MCSRRVAFRPRMGIGSAHHRSPRSQVPPLKAKSVSGTDHDARRIRGATAIHRRGVPRAATSPSWATSSAFARCIALRRRVAYFPNSGSAQACGSISAARCNRAWVSNSGVLVLCPPNTDVTLSAIYKCHRGSGRASGWARSPSVAQRPTDGRFTGARNRSRCFTERTSARSAHRKLSRP